MDLRRSSIETHKLDVVIADRLLSGEAQDADKQHNEESDKDKQPKTITKQTSSYSFSDTSGSDSEHFKNEYIRKNLIKSIKMLDKDKIE